MWEFIVTWCLVTMTVGSCPDALKKDEFGRYSNLGVCAIAHWETVTDCDHSKSFDSKEEALAFKERALSSGTPNSMFGFGSSISSVELDSVVRDTSYYWMAVDTLYIRDGSYFDSNGKIWKHTTN